jgi:ubiquinone/menaquinone biosynthesis C-methylase UbiE
VSLMTDEQFDEFFKPYAGNVEGFYEVAYWTLSDELIKELVRRHLGLESGQRVIDVGGGTGRWGIWLASEFDVHVTVADKSTRMLRQAAENVEAAGLQDRITLLHTDIEDAVTLVDGSFDAALSTYGVLSFLDDPPAAFRTLARVLRPGAVGLLMSHSLSNAIASKINRDGADAAELAELAEQRVVRWAPHVPPLRVYTASDLRDLASAAGLAAPRVFGVTSLVQPGPEDFGYPYSSVSAVSRALEDPAYFRRVLDLELAATEHEDWGERGVNLMVKVIRP